ncbi:hypothetical protein [Bradyrhizobium sp. ARR65]|uniref:hypothetical protein n=1 Tax=Bradyrhizobium sp. ARR65 TaxID=1040989 RepID=UPI0004667C58|nr:hypothetical protein [Bradyrhizobium sp. ARR65]
MWLDPREERPKGGLIIYQYRTLEADHPEMRVAHCWGTREAIAGLEHTEVLEDAATDVETSQ